MTERRKASFAWQYGPAPDANGWFGRDEGLPRHNGLPKHDWVWLWWGRGRVELHQYDTVPREPGWTHWKPADGPPVRAQKHDGDEMSSIKFTPKHRKSKVFTEDAVPTATYEKAINGLHEVLAQESPLDMYEAAHDALEELGEL